MILFSQLPPHLHYHISLFIYKFAISDLGVLHYFLGISNTHSSSSLFFSQSEYARELLVYCHMSTTNSVSTPVDSKYKFLSTDGDPLFDATKFRSIVGALQYLTFTRPDLTFTIQQVCLFMSAPRTSHMKVVKRILRYLKGTIDDGILLSQDP